MDNLRDTNQTSVDQSVEFQKFKQRVVGNEPIDRGQLDSIFARAYEKMPDFKQQIRNLQEQSALADLKQLVNQLQGN